MVAECRYALTGVGAVIAPGSQAWNGYCADLVNAPMRISTSATVTVVPDGGAATIALRRYVPAAWPSRTNPASIARPPVDVTSRACSAAARAFGLVWSLPISRYEL